MPCYSRPPSARTPLACATVPIVYSTPELAEWMLAENVPARLGLQLHKFDPDPALKGV